MKTCGVCGREKPVEEFRVQFRRGRPYRHVHCMECAAEIDRVRKSKELEGFRIFGSPVDAVRRKWVYGGLANYVAEFKRMVGKPSQEIVPTKPWLIETEK